MLVYMKLDVVYVDQQTVTSDVFGCESDEHSDTDDRGTQALISVLLLPLLS